MWTEEKHLFNRYFRFLLFLVLCRTCTISSSVSFIEWILSIYSVLDTDSVSHWSSRISGLEGNFKLIESFHPFLFKFSVCSSNLKEILCCKLWKASIMFDWIESCKYFWISCQPVALWLWHCDLFVLVAQLCMTLCNSINCSPSGSSPLSLASCPDKNTGMGCHSLLQGIFLT